MKTPKQYVILLFIFLMISCSQQEFPGATSVDTNAAIRNVPFLETFIFNFKTGAGPITGANPGGNLTAISQAVLLTMLSSAQEEVLQGTGVLTGLVHSNGAAVKDVALKVTDAAGNLLAIRAEGRFVGPDLIMADGTKCPSQDPGIIVLDNICIKGSLFYNSLGGVPDFSNNKGTSPSGTFTIFNLPPGDVYLWAFRGGRGNARIKVFGARVSVGNVPVVPIPVSTVLVDGQATEAEVTDQPVFIEGAAVTLLGSSEANLSTSTDSAGQYNINPVGTSGNHLIKISKSGHWPTYHALHTAPFQSTDELPDVTKNLTLFANSYINKFIAGTGIGIDTNLGVLTGRILFGNGTSQHCAKLTVRDAAGQDLLTTGGAVLFYSPSKPDPLTGIDTLRPNCVDPADGNQTGTDGFYFIYNLPPGEIDVRFTSTVSTGTPGNEDISSGGGLSNIFKGVVLVQDLAVSGTAQSQELTGSILDENEAAVADARITVLGLSEKDYQYDLGGTSSPFSFPLDAISEASGSYAIRKNILVKTAYPLDGGGLYRLKVSKTGSPDTYQLVLINKSATTQDLFSASAALSPLPGSGKIYGNLINQATGRPATDVQLEITDLSGKHLQTISSTDGTFQSIDLSPGLVNLSITSGDDSGNMIARIFADGVTFVAFPMSKVIPAKVSVSGSIRDLNQSLVPQATLSVLGRLPGQGNGLKLDGAGNYSTKLATNGRFVIKAEQNNFYDTYNVFPGTGLVDSLTPSDLYAISRSQIANLAGVAGIPIDSSKGIIVGTTTANGFAAKVAPATCTDPGPHQSTLGFFNQDTVIDLAVTQCTGPDSVTLFFGNASGDGSFMIDQSYAVGTNPTDIATGDFNGDGIADLVISNFVSANPAGDVISFSILLGDKKAGFALQALPVSANDNTGNTFADPSAVVVGRFDADAKLDIAIAYRGANRILVYSGNGDGSFSPALDSTQNIDAHIVGTNPADMITGDFNKDNRIDLAVANTDSNDVTVLLGNTTGGFPTIDTVAVGDKPVALVSVDLNADGQADLAVINQVSRTVSILSSDVSGTFLPLTDANDAIVPDLVLPGNPSALSWGDFNNDNRVDLAIALQSTNEAIVFLGDGDGRFSQSKTEALTVTGPDDVLALDANQDGLHDLLSVGSGIETLLGTEAPVGGMSVAVRDLNGIASGATLYPGSTSSSTSADGSFVILNVDPGLTMTRVSSGGAGNSFIETFSDAVVFTKIRTATVAPFQISVQGAAYDPVGPAPGVPAGNVKVEVLGMGAQTITNAQGTYQFTLDANSEYVLKLFFETP